MKKLLMIGLIVPVAVLLAFGSVTLAEQQDDKPELNQELNKDLADRAAARAGTTELSLTDDTQTDSLGDGSSEVGDLDRGIRSFADKRGRQDRRGQTSIVVAGTQGKNDEDGNSGKSADEDDEDEDGDITPTAP